MLAPRWVLALYYGVFFGVHMGLFTGIRDSSVLGGVVAGLVEGLVFSAIMTSLTTRMRERMRVQIGGLSLERLRVARKSSWRGPIPADPAVRADALVIAHEALRQAERFRWVGVGAVRRLPGPRDRARGHRLVNGRGGRIPRAVAQQTRGPTPPPGLCPCSSSS